MNRLCVLITFLTVPSLVGVVFAEEKLNFEEHILPIFKEHCNGCHNPDKRKADLDLTNYSGMIVGSSGGEVVKAGVPDTSWLYETITHAEDVEPMPPKKPMIPDEQIALIRRWIQDGLIEKGGGKSMLRRIEFDVTTATSSRPEGEPTMPKSLPATPPTETAVPVAVTALATSPWAPLIAVSGQEQILLKHAETRELIGVLPFPEGVVQVLRFSRNGSLLLAGGGVGGNSGKVILFDVETGRRIAEIGDEQDAVLAADISADHRFVALGGPSKVVKVFQATTGELLHRIEKHTDWITGISFAPDGDQFASADRNGGIHVWEGENGAIVYSLNEHKVRVSDLAWRADGKMLASGAEDGKLVLWDMKDGWPAKVVDAHKAEAINRYTRRTGVLAIDWARSGELVTVGRDRSIRMWSSSGDGQAELGKCEAIPTRISFMNDTGKAMVGDLAGELHILPTE